VDAIELLKTQHQEVKGLFKRIEKAEEEDEKQDRRRRWSRLRRA